MEDARYQSRLIALMAFTWGFVFLDRVVITYLFPVLVDEFGFSGAEVGAINMMTSLGYVGSPATRKIRGSALGRLRIREYVRLIRSLVDGRTAKFGEPKVSE